MRKEIFLDELPRGGKYINKNSINWKESIGHKVKFVYDDIEDEIEIVDYDPKTRYLSIKYNNKIIYILNGDFLNCKLGNILSKKTSDFKVEIGTTFKDNKRDITIIDREIREVKIENNKCKKGYTILKRKWYKYKCNKDFNEDWIEESHLLKGGGCNVCAGRYKDNMWNTHRELCVQLGIPKEIAETTTSGSSIPITFNCKCGNEVTISPNTITTTKSIGCKKCSDGISYPNKFMYEFCRQLLEQGKIKYFEVEYKIKNKRYDIFIILNNSKTLIIENHGGQHGEFITEGDLLFIKKGNGFKQSNRNDIKEDIYKCRLAYENGIDNYIQLDCNISDIHYIKHSIKNSILNELFDLTEINWLECNEYALKNIVYEVCKFWEQHRGINKENITITDLSKIFKLDRRTIGYYLKKGVELGWRNYSGKLKPILVYDKEMNFIGEYESAKYICEHSVELFGICLNRNYISDVATGKRSSYKGYIFKFKIY